VLVALRIALPVKKSAAVLVSTVPLPSTRAMTRFTVAEAVLATAAVPGAAS
jgi:hypothetical protein